MTRNSMGSLDFESDFPGNWEYLHVVTRLSAPSDLQRRNEFNGGFECTDTSTRWREGCERFSSRAGASSVVTLPMPRGADAPSHRRVLLHPRPACTCFNQRRLGKP